MDARKLALTLARSESEANVIAILKNAGLWNDDSAWRFYGDKENNFADIGNQQSRPEAALVEKITNSVDAVLMRECLVRGINPEGPDAPRTIQEALQAFFDIRDGRLSNLDPRTRSKLAENICVVATGQKPIPAMRWSTPGRGRRLTCCPRPSCPSESRTSCAFPLFRASSTWAAPGCCSSVGGGICNS